MPSSLNPNLCCTFTSALPPSVLCVLLGAVAACCGGALRARTHEYCHLSLNCFPGPCATRGEHLEQAEAAAAQMECCHCLVSAPLEARPEEPTGEVVALGRVVALGAEAAHSEAVQVRSVGEGLAACGGAARWFMMLVLDLGQLGARDGRLW